MIRLRGVNKIHDPDGPGCFQALWDIDLDVEPGQAVVVQGVSGSGKTTLLSILGALSRPTSGQVLIAGRQVAKLPDVHASAFRLATVGFLFQDHRLLPQLSVLDNATVPLLPTGDSPARITDLALAALETAGIAHKAAQKVRDLSGGEKQRCAIARALVNDPQLLLCDEPTSNLDSDSRRALLDTLEALKGRGKTILVATHDPVFDGQDWVDRTVRLREGRIVEP